MVLAEDREGKRLIKQPKASSGELKELEVPAFMQHDPPSDLTSLDLLAKETATLKLPVINEEIKPVLSPDPLAAVAALTLIGGGLAAAGGLLPEVSGPIASFLSAIAGNQAFS